MYCSNCGKEVADKAVVCIHCGCAIAQPQQKSSFIAIILLLVFGTFGIHNFYLGNHGAATLQLILGLLGWATVAVGLGVILLIILAVWLFVDFLFLIFKGEDVDGNPLK